MDRRAEIEARLAAATPGPWGAGPNRVFAANADGTPATGGMRVGMYPHIASVYREDDAALVAAAPADLRWLLAELARVERERDVAVEATQPGAVTFFIDEALRLESMLHALARRVVEDDDPMTMARDLIANTGGLSTRMVSEGARVTASGWVPRLIAEQFFRAFDDGGATNNIEWSISHKGRHATITAQIRGAATPSEQRDAARADVARLERELAEARTEAARSAAAAVDAAQVTAERDALRAILEGRTTPPTPEEIAAHAGSAQCGVWLWVDRDGWVATGRMFAGLHQFEPHVVRFWPLDAEGRPCAWPVTGAHAP